MGALEAEEGAGEDEADTETLDAEDMEMAVIVAFEIFRETERVSST